MLAEPNADDPVFIGGELDSLLHDSKLRLAGFDEIWQLVEDELGGDSDGAMERLYAKLAKAQQEA